MSDFILIRNKVTDTSTYYAIKVKAQADYGTAYALYSEKGFNHFQDLTTFGNALRLGPVTTAVRDMIIPQDGMLIWNIDEAAMEYYGGGAWRNFDATFIVNPGTGISITGDGSTLTPYVVSLDLTYADNRYVNVSGDTMTGFLTLNADPTSSLHAATKQYVDSLAQGLKPKQSVKAATTGAITIASAPSSLDTVTLTSGDRILVKNQALSRENGIYIFNGTGNPLTRALDMDSWAEVPSAYLFIEEGATLADTFWVCTSDQGGTLDTTAIVWVQFSTAGTYTASNGITLASNDFSLGGALIQNTTITTAGFSFSIKRSAGDEELFSISNNLIYLYVESVLGFTDLTFNGSEILGISKSNNDRVLLSLVTGASSTNSIGSIEATDLSTYYSKFETKSTGISLKTKTSSGGTYKGISIDMSGNATFDTIANATIDTDKFLVSDSGVLKYRTGAEVLSDIGGAPVSGSTNYIHNQNASAQTANFWISGNGRLNGSLGIGIAPTSNLHVEGIIKATTGAGKFTTIGWDGTNVEILTITDAGLATVKLQSPGSIYTSLSSVGNITLANTGFKVIGTGAVEWVSLGTYGGWVFNETGADSDFRIESVGAVNMFFVDASTNSIGINNGAPSFTLDVTGTSRVSNSAAVAWTSGSLTVGSTANIGQVTINLKQSTNLSLGWLIGYTSNLENNLYFYGSESNGAFYLYTNTQNRLAISSAGSVVFNENGLDADFRIEGDTDANLFFLDASVDRIGIGTTSTVATYKLTVNGGMATIGGAVDFNNAQGNFDLLIRSQVNPFLFFADASADAIGIGTNNPVAKVHINSVGYAGVYVVNADGFPAIQISQPDKAYMLFNKSGGSAYSAAFGLINSSGDIAINQSVGWSGPTTHIFYGSGDLGITGSGAFGTTTVTASAILAATSTTRGFLPPRMTAAQRGAITSPAIGLLVYQTDSVEGLYENTSSGWRLIYSTATTITGSGTTNYITKWTSSTALGNSLLFDNGVSIGLNTITPSASYILDINGGIRITDSTVNAALIVLGATGVFKVTGNAGGPRFTINETTNVTWAYTLVSGNFAAIDDTWTRFNGSYVQFNNDAYLKVNSNSLIIKKDSPTLSASRNLILDDDGSVPHANYKPFIVNINSVEKFSITKDGYILAQAPSYSSGGFDYVVRNQTTGRLELSIFSIPAHNLLSASHSDTVVASPVLGDIIISNSTPAWSKLAGNTTTSKRFLSQTGNGTISAAPSWSAILASDIGSGAALTKTDDTNVTITLGGSPSVALLAATSLTLGWSGQLSLARGGTGANLVDPNGDKILFWDDSAGTVTWLDLGTNLSISGTTLNASAGAGGYATVQEEGTGLTARTTLNFIGGGFTAADDAGNSRTNITLDATLNALAAYNTNGILTQTGADTFVGRTITGTASRITVTNGDGVAGNPTIDISSAYVGQATITTLGTITTGTWHASVISEIYGGTNQSTYTLGDILYASATNTLSKLAGNTLTSKRFLVQTGTGVVSAAPTWSTILASDIASGAALTKTDDTNVTLTLGGTPASALLVAASITVGWSGQLSISRGGTGASTKTTAFNALTPNTTLGDISYHNGTNEVRLGGNITTGKQFLSQTGTGTVSAAPVWATITGADITGAALTKTDDTNVTLTLGGTPSTALLRAASLTLGWAGQLSLARGGTGANLTDPGADRILFWDDSAGTMTWLDLGTNLSISGTTLNASAGAGGYATIQEEGFGLTARTTLNFAGGGFTASDDAGNNRTNITLDTTLNVLASYNTNGILTQTAADTFTGRTIVGTTNRLTVTNGDGVSGNPTLDISSAYPGQTSITVLGTVTTGIWNASVISAIYGGTNQTTYTLGDILYSSATNTLAKLAGNITTTKQFLSQTGNGSVSAAPVWATISGSDITGAALTKTDDTNVTLTLGGTPGTSLLRAASLTLGWSGQLALARGGTGANLTDPNADRILFWDDSGSAVTWLEVVSPLIISGTQLQFDTSVALNNNARLAVSKNSGVTVGTRRRINFIEGTNITLTIADDAGNEEIDVTITASGGVSTHNLLDSTVHTDTTTGTVARGDLITGQTATPKWTRLAKGTASQFLQSDGTDLAWITLSGDATLSAGVLTIANNAITNVKVNDVAWSKITGRPTTLSGYGITDALSNSTTSTQDGYFGDIYLRDDTTPSHYLQITIAENLTAARSLSIITGDASRTLTFTGNATISGTNTGDQTITLTGDVTGSGTGSFAATIANDAVTNAKLANVSTATFKGRVTAGTGDPEDLTGTQATTLLDVFTSALKGLAPASGGGTTNFLRADGTWAAPTASSVLLNSIAAATGTNTINNGAHAQEWQWNTLAGATAFKLSSTSTAAASSAQKLLEVLLSGANSTSSQWTYAGYFSNTHTGTSSTNYGIYATASGGTKNWAATFVGPVMFSGSLNTKVGDVTDANYTVGENDSILVLPTPSVSRTLTLPSASSWDGRILILKNHSTSDTNLWNLSENIFHESNERQLVDYGISSLEPGTNYILESDGAFWYCISQSINEKIRYLNTTDATSNQVIATIFTDSVEAGIIEVYVIGIDGANVLSNVGKKIAKYYNNGTTLTISDITDVLVTTNSIGVAAAWNLNANNPNIEVRVTGKASTTINWRCVVRKTKLFYAT